MYNQITLIGRVGKEPETRKTRSGSEYIAFSLATSETWKDQAGERQEDTVWHNIVVWPDGLRRIVTGHVHKGDLLTVIGQQRNRSWKDDADKWHNQSEVRVAARGQIVLMPKKRDGAQPPEEPPFGTSGPASHTDQDDEIPF